MKRHVHLTDHEKGNKICLIVSIQFKCKSKSDIIALIKKSKENHKPYELL